MTIARYEPDENGYRLVAAAIAAQFDRSPPVPAGASAQPLTQSLRTFCRFSAIVILQRTRGTSIEPIYLSDRQSLKYERMNNAMRCPAHLHSKSLRPHRSNGCRNGALIAAATYLHLAYVQGRNPGGTMPQLRRTLRAVQTRATDRLA